MEFISCITWIKKGVAKSTPDKMHLTREDLQTLITDTTKDIRNNEEENEEITMTNSAAIENNDSENEDISAKYNLDDYDEEESSNPIVNIAGLTVFADNDDDPYITVKDKEDDSDDDDDFIIRPTDNLIAVGKVQEDCSILEVYVFNEEEDDLYVHHDIILPAFPLAVEWLNFDPAEDILGNYVAIGDMTPIIRIWDVDIVDALEPSYTLGKRTKKKKEKAKYYGHKDAVLDLSWNRNARQILASGSADHKVLIWDILKAEYITRISEHKEKVQTLEWHPSEAQVLLTGSCDNTVKLFDGRNPEDGHKTFTVEGEVEKVTWNHFNPFYFLASTDRGFVYCFDSRTEELMYSVQAHAEEVTGLSLSTKCQGCLVTSSTDNTVKVWDINGNEPKLIAERSFELGSIHALSLSPDSPLTLAIGGDNKSNTFKVWDATNVDSVRSRFLNGVTEDRMQNPGADEATNSVNEDCDEMEMESINNIQNLKLNSSETGTKPKKKFRQFKSKRKTE